MNLVQESYYYDIIEDKWIEGWKTLADGRREPIYE